ncbi:uncharacterized protein LOC125293832 isoform X2 [Alosa alosa]|uniref:uncharacterized protein LOC125293832 isoform X2 n=1 Tax=Alosa alosa TaxID=278164 RepID=UPI002015354A|nr:uncharacterized protein LOC125293832 isoform X2 [Alosa alosa]
MSGCCVFACQNRFNRKRRRDEIGLPSSTIPTDTSMSEEQLPSATEEEDVVPIAEYNALRVSHDRLQEECASLHRDVIRLTAENEKLKEDLKTQPWSLVKSPDFSGCAGQQGLALSIQQNHSSRPVWW